MVNEAEAAAMYAVEWGFHTIEARQNIANLDSGGGTTEGAVYRTSHGFPLRLSRELIAAQGIMWGGADVNQEFRMQLHEDIKHKRCFSTIEPGWSKHDLIEACVREFDSAKRNFVDENDGDTYEFRMVGLQPHNNNPRLTHGFYVLTSKDMGKIIRKVAKKIRILMQDLLDRARAADAELHKLVLTGGFGDSPYLRATLKACLIRYNEAYGTDTEWIVAPPQRSGTSTAIGTLMRALNKEHGPVRALRMSVGVIRDIPYQPSVYEELGIPEVMKQNRERGTDGKFYVFNTIEWLLKAGTDDSQHSYKHTFKAAYLFAEDEDVWVVLQELAMHPTATEDCWKRDDKKNQGTVSGGVATFDITHLKDYIMEHQDSVVSRGVQSWCVDLDVCVEMNDIDIKLTALWQGPDDTTATEVPGFRICQNVRGLLDPGTKE